MTQSPIARPVDEPRLPVTIVTGFLGSGKTTLVNHILAHPTGLRIAVMVNEFGDVAIDNDLIIGAGDDMVELTNGCVCCSINNDLVDAIGRVLQRGERIDYLIVETTGLADPLPIVLTFLRPEFRGAIRIDAIVALADAESFSPELFDSRPARNQLRYADFVLLNKCDSVSPERADTVEKKIRGLAEAARILRVTHASAPLPLILGAELFNPDRQPPAPDHDHDAGHIAADGFEAVSFQSDRALSADKFQSFLEALPGNVFRAKGVLAIDAAGRHVFHLVGGRFTLDKAPEGLGEGLGGRNRLVLIGRNLDAEELHARLTACLVADVTPAAE